MAKVILKSKNPYLSIRKGKNVIQFKPKTLADKKTKSEYGYYSNNLDEKELKFILGFDGITKEEV